MSETKGLRTAKCPNCGEEVRLHAYEIIESVRPVDDDGMQYKDIPDIDPTYRETLTRWGKCENCGDTFDVKLVDDGLYVGKTPQVQLDEEIETPTTVEAMQDRGGKIETIIEKLENDKQEYGEKGSGPSWVEGYNRGLDEAVKELEALV